MTMERPPVSATLQQLADLVHGAVRGDRDLVITRARSLAEAEPGDISFVENENHTHELHRSRASAVVVPAGFPANGQIALEVADPLTAFVTIAQHLRGRREPVAGGIHPQAWVHPGAAVAPDATIEAFAVVGEGAVVGARCHIHGGVVIGRDCRLGDEVTLYPNVVLYDGTVLGKRVIIHANAVIGADGFGYRTVDGRHVKVPQLGCVEIGDDVEIGACSTIDRGTFQATRVGAGTKIDNLVQIGHNCGIGCHNLIVSQAGIAGSSTTGNHVVIAGQVGIVGHVRIGDGAMIGAQAGVTKDVPAGHKMLGSPATPVIEQKRILVTLEKLPEIRHDIRRIKQHLGLPDDEKH